MSAFDTEIEGGLSDALKNRVTRLVYKYLKAFGEGIRVAMLGCCDALIICCLLEIRVVARKETDLQSLLGVLFDELDRCSERVVTVERYALL